MVNYTLKVISIKKETEDTYTYIFKQPGLKKIKYLPGQYITLIFRINGRRYLRPYSFSSAPEVDSGLHITVKRMYKGVVSNHIIDKIQIGDLIEAISPMGGFVLPETVDLEEKHIVLWGSGSGITPLISIAKHALNKQMPAHITLVYGNKNHQTTIFADELKDLQCRYGNKFSIWHFYTNAILETSNPYILPGRIAPQEVLKVLTKQGDLRNTLHYICGPASLKKTIIQTLKQEGISEDYIFSEDFEVVRNAEDFEDIITRNVTISIGNLETEFEVANGKSILEAGLDALLELSYSCQTGDCLLCRGRVIEGKVKMLGAKKQTLLSEDECLLCCSFPLTDNININIE